MEGRSTLATIRTLKPVRTRRSPRHFGTDTIPQSTSTIKRRTTWNGTIPRTSSPRTGLSRSVSRGRRSRSRTTSGSSAGCSSRGTSSASREGTSRSLYHFLGTTRSKVSSQLLPHRLQEMLMSVSQDSGLLVRLTWTPSPRVLLTFDPAVWTMGNLGRAGYGGSLEGNWPVSLPLAFQETNPDAVNPRSTPTTS